MQTFSKLIKQIGRRFLELRKPFKITLAVLFLLLTTVLLYPFQTVVVPAWNLQVVDDAGKPVTRITVTEHWQHYLLETQGHDELKLTNEAGRVDFTARTIRASVLRRFLATLGKLTSSGSDARRDRYAAVVVWGSSDHSLSTTVYQPDDEPPETVIVQRSH